MKINRHLNIVIPIDRDDGTKIYVHAAPIRTETFETYYLVLSRAWSNIMQHGIADPQVFIKISTLSLMQMAKETARGPGLNWFEGPDGVGGERGLIAEMIRLSNVVVSSDENGWGSVPLQQALSDGTIDEVEKKEVLEILTFFTLISHVASRDHKRMFLEYLYAMGVPNTSSNSTEYVTFLKTSTIEDASGENGQV